MRRFVVWLAGLLAVTTLAGPALGVLPTKGGGLIQQLGRTISCEAGSIAHLGSGQAPATAGASCASGLIRSADHSPSAVLVRRVRGGADAVASTFAVAGGHH